MDAYRLSRRDAFRAGGGLLGAVGALAVMAKTARAEPWSWSPQGSVVGSGNGADPLTLFDPEADAVIADVMDHADVPAVNRLLGTWTRNGQPIPDGLPNNLRDFMESARQLPSWADQGKLAASFDFTQKRGTYLGVLYAFASGMMSTVIPHEALAVYYSRGGSHLKDRIAKTAKLGYDIGTVNAYAPDGEMIVTCVKTRMIHAAVRHLLPQSPHWPADTTPISQNDLMVTWHSLATTIMRTFDAWHVVIPPAESDGYLHSWQLAGHLIGIRDEYIPASWDQANSQATQVLDPILAPTAEGVDLAHKLLDLGFDLDLSLLSAPILGAFTRFILGDRVADWLQIPREPVWSPLLQVAWGPFVAVKEGVQGAIPPSADAAWMFDEFLRQFVLWYVSELHMPISIEIPLTNR
ncbi:oxygenase MpaB family protein [Nocardia sp. alder85J]|uniref:oxygenase MpaB family protein n=1 Tax=Nocardia sp. alder85J TaxID=2862949 RepID=UPI001CD1DF6F|nr:oxygenase MpaB family protein [Nocardia sp. alder85J]MCX4096868.1 oxygenase MpaB family protein [Nocardia sp. alder85J]